MSPRKPNPDDWKEALHHGEATCEGCGAVDLSKAETVNEAIEIWNAHVREEHPEQLDETQY